MEEHEKFKDIKDKYEKHFQKNQVIRIMPKRKN